MNIIECQRCGKQFKPLRSSSKYCSVHCANKKQSKEHIAKRVAKQIGRPCSEAKKKKISKALMGHKRSLESRKKQSISARGLTKTEEHKQKISEALKGKKRPYAIDNFEKFYATITKEERRALYSKYSLAFWAKLNKEERRKHMSKASAASCLANPSSIEFSIRKILDILKIKYEVNQQVGSYFPDIIIPCANLIIECDGDYWHNKPGAQEKDKERDKYLREQGYEVVRIWEHEIKKEPKKALLKAIS